jgi:hypothetical protein
MKSFTTNQEQVNFDIDGEMFYLRPAIAAGKMFSASSLKGKIEQSVDDPDTNAGKVLLAELAEIFEPESFQRFEARFWGHDQYGNPVNNPINPATFNAVIEWLFGEALGKGTTPQ